VDRYEEFMNFIRLIRNPEIIGEPELIERNFTEILDNFSRGNPLAELKVNNMDITRPLQYKY
jgi:hypothetical protein